MCAGTVPLMLPDATHPSSTESTIADATVPDGTTDTRARTRLTLATVGALVAGSALGLALLLQWFEVYFFIWDPPPPPSPAEGVRYLWTAGLALTLLLAAVILANARGRGGLIVLATVALVCAIIGAFVFQVPKDRFSPQPADFDDGGPHPVCYGTTGDCPGG